ncbi:MAG: DNA polymerase Y family protein [Actinomycetota bacterium]
MPRSGRTDAPRLVVPRLVVVVCPQWPVVAVGCAVDEPLAIVHANRVVARSRAAAAAGVRIGQRRRDAQARCPQLRVVPHDPAGEARAFHRVVDAVADVVPRLELGVPGSLSFMARGPSRYFGGDEAMAAMVAERVEAVLGSAVQAAGRPGVGVADGRFAAGVAARLAARAGRPEVVERGGSPRLLADLPVALLADVGGIERDRVELFVRLGLHRLGDIAALPEPDLLARFGPAGVVARQMAAGVDDRPLDAQAPPEGLVAAQRFEPPLAHLDAVVFVGRSLADQLVVALAATGRVCTQFVVVVDTDRGHRSERVWSLPTGFGVAAMVERIRWQLDGWAARAETSEGAVGVVELRLEPTEVRADDGVQAGLWGGRTHADEWAQRAATRLAGLVGDEQVVVAEWRGGRQPVDQYRWVPASLSTRFEAVGDARASSSEPASGQPWPGQLPAPSPAVVFAEPHALEVLDRAGVPVVVSARGALSGEPSLLRREPGDDQPESIVAWAGPWLLDERWWDTARHRRVARFQLLTAAGRAYLATVERQRWWVIAEYG